MISYRFRFRYKIVNENFIFLFLELNKEGLHTMKNTDAIYNIKVQ